MAVVSAVSGLNMALPTLARETGASQTDLTWIVDAYTVVFAGLLLFAGALGDRYGRRQTYQINLLVFGAAAIGATFSPNMATLIALRFVMGLGLGAEAVVGYAMVTEFFPRRTRGRAGRAGL